MLFIDSTLKTLTNFSGRVWKFGNTILLYHYHIESEITWKGVSSVPQRIYLKLLKWSSDVSPSITIKLAFLMNYLNNYLMYCLHIWFSYSWCPEDESWCFGEHRLLSWNEQLKTSLLFPLCCWMIWWGKYCDSSAGWSPSLSGITFLT